MPETEVVEVCVDDKIWSDVCGPLKVQSEELIEFFWHGELPAVFATTSWVGPIQKFVD